MPERARVLLALPEVVRPILLEAIEGRDTCVVSTRVGLGVLAYFGISARAVPTSFVAFNSAGWEAACSGTPVEQWPEHAHSVGAAGPFGRDPITGKLNGHLVIAADDRYLVDMSADQYARPLQDIAISARTLKVPPGWDWRPGQRLLYRHEGTAFVYEIAPQEPAVWRASPQWRIDADVRDVIGRAIRAMRERLQSAPPEQPGELQSLEIWTRAA